MDWRQKITQSKSGHKNPSWGEIKHKIENSITINQGGCWVWNGPLNTGGYSRIWGDLGHRMSYMAYVGPIGGGLDIDHLCRNRACVNPEHLEPVTRKVNLSRGVGVEMQKQKAAQRTSCSNGHELTEDNTYIRPSDGSKICRDCKKFAGSKYRKEKKDEINARKRRWRKSWRARGIRK